MMTSITNRLIVTAALLTLGAVACWPASSGEQAAASVTTTFEVQGMTCGGCEAGVKAKVRKLDGVESVAASHQNGTATVVLDPSKVTPDQIIAAIKELGYEARLARGSRR